MSETVDKEFLPKVTITRKDKVGSFGLNFKVGHLGMADEPVPVAQLIRLADDWTSYCVASLEFIPGMASSGFFWVDHAITEEDMDFLKALSISSEETEDAEGETKYSYIFHEEDLSEVAKRMETTSQMLRAAKVVQRSTLASLLSEFDYFLARFLQICADAFPEKFLDEQETLTIGELKKSESIAQIIADRCRKKIKKLMYGSHAETIEWLFEKFGLETSGGKYRQSDIYKEFIEVCQRRHIMTHNGGIANEEYVHICKAAGLKKDQYLTLGEEAQVSRRYLKRATARVYLQGYYMLQLFLQSSFKDSRRVAFDNLLATSHTFLENDLTKMCTRVINFAEFPNKQFDQDLKLKFGINKSLAQLFDPALPAGDQLNEAKKILEKYDWSVKTPTFELALACIRREFDDIVELATAASQFGLKYSEARTYVVFREAREIEGFLACFERTPLMIENAPY